jgi:glycosyltransferase involved in cell wall biosynthesis
MMDKKTLLLVSHVSEYPGGPLEKFYQYLKEYYTVYKVTHPITLTTNQKSSIDFEKKHVSFKIPPFAQYLFEGTITLLAWYKYFKLPPKIDLAICFDSLSYLHTYLSKAFLRIDKIVYYNVDYSKKRFSNFFMNTIYQAITRFSYITCDYFFSFDNKFLDDIDPYKRFSAKHIIIKPLIDLRSIHTKVRKFPKSLVYVGSLDYATVDFTFFLQALKKLKDEEVAFTLSVFGNKSSSNPIHKEIRSLKLKERIIFHGVIENDKLTQDILPRYTIGIAPYALNTNPHAPDHAFMNKDLTGRIVEYIGVGLPVISTRITPAFRVIDEKQIGFSVTNTEEWYSAIKALLTNKTLYKRYSKNARHFAKNYASDTILRPIFRRIFP